MRILVFDGMFSEPVEMDIKGDLKSMQEVVGGFIQFTPFKGNLEICCNEEGKLMGMQGTRYLHNERVPQNNGIYDLIVGRFFIGRRGKTDLTDKEIEYIKSRDMGNILLTEWK